MATLIDSYSESNVNGSDVVFGSGGGDTSKRGQSLTCGGVYTLDSAKFYLKKTGSPTGNAYAELWSHSGDYGTSSVGSSLLATSDTFDVSSLTTSSQLITFTFSAAQRIELAASYYVLMLKFTGGDASNNVQIGYDSSSPSASGNYVYMTNVSTWGAISAVDIAFYLYGEAAAAGTSKDALLLGCG
jgi:hypothetical protein